MSVMENKQVFAISMGLLVVGLQIVSLLVLGPMLLGLIPGISDNSLKVILASVPIAVPIFIFYAKTGTFVTMFDNLKNSILWGSVFWGLSFIVDISIVILARYSITGELRFPSFSLTRLSLYYVFFAVIFFPIIEEILYRGYILQMLKDSTPMFLAVLITAALGVLMHVIASPGVSKLSLVFIGSIIFCGSYIKGGLGAAIIVHSLANLSAIATVPFSQ